MRRGFTLIELLVVIAIIGVLAAVVLAALNIGRDKGVDAAIRGDLDGVRPQAHLFYDANGNNYVTPGGAGSATDVCSATADGSATNNTRGIYTMILAASQKAGIGSVSVNAAGGPGIAICNSTEGEEGGAWAAEVPLKTSGFYCVDSVGAATTTIATSIASSTDMLCD